MGSGQSGQPAQLLPSPSQPTPRQGISFRAPKHSRYEHEVTEIDKITKVENDSFLSSDKGSRGCPAPGCQRGECPHHLLPLGRTVQTRPTLTPKEDGERLLCRLVSRESRCHRGAARKRTGLLPQRAFLHVPTPPPSATAPNFSASQSTTGKDRDWRTLS